jgi:hypothetical protein
MRGIIEDDSDFLNEINNSDLQKLCNFMVYITSNDWVFHMQRKNECMLTHYQISLPTLTTFSMRVRFFYSYGWRVDNGASNLYNYLYSPSYTAYDGFGRFRISSIGDSTLSSIYLNKTGVFTKINVISSGQQIYDIYMTFDDGTPTNTSQSSINMTFTVLEWYSYMNSSGIDDRFVNDITFMKTSYSPISTVTIELRDIEMNKAFTSTDTVGQVYPDFTYQFEVEELI